VAQLVAHLHGMQGVRGSNPLSSTRFIRVASGTTRGSIHLVGRAYEAKAIKIIGLP
jgi:hypothetical protein